MCIKLLKKIYSNKLELKRILIIIYDRPETTCTSHHAKYGKLILTAWSVGAVLWGTGIKCSDRSPPITCENWLVKIGKKNKEMLKKKIYNSTNTFNFL